MSVPATWAARGRDFVVKCRNDEVVFGIMVHCCLLDTLPLEGSLRFGCTAGGSNYELVSAGRVQKEAFF